ncbi:hopanoid biosynthesis-associated protein HpnK [Lichenihabitans psoromatis]|uniref:hopanoid biosynthesis-associated protein HpnK n=1 Tax=Lichenihabitans psoromatis TaxID=2528642 RepID=UPI0010384E44|nr:hopanoid biosynthesis-associated protein HpnK [Lichenihabitans psoromatis]
MKDLIVTADDFGLAIEVNDAVEEAHAMGILTAASLMVGSPACADAVERAHRLPKLRVGLHLTLVEATPVLPPELVPDLVDANGMFRSDMAKAGASMFFRPSVRRQLEDEIDAQFAAFLATGLTLDHVNAHKHFHLHPTIAGTLIAVGHRYGMRAVRVPSEPLGIVRRIDPASPLAIPALTAPFTRMLRNRMVRAGLVVPDQVFGLAWSGAMTTDKLVAILDRLPPGLTEIYTHPATSGAFVGAAPGYRYAEELAALTSEPVKAALERSHALTGGFADFG